MELLDLWLIALAHGWTANSGYISMKKVLITNTWERINLPAYACQYGYVV